MMNYPLVSIIVPVYNTEKYLNRCIDSILAQTFMDFELILVDDGSTDGSGAICDEYAQKDPRVVVIHQKNKGQAAARNRALDIAQGEYIGFVDSDDYIHPQMYEILLNQARIIHADISVCGYQSVSETKALMPVPNPGCRQWNGRDFLKHCLLNQVDKKPWVLWDKVFRRACFASLRMPEGRIYEDNAVVYKLIYAAERIADCDEKLYCYCFNENSTVNQNFQKKHLDWLIVLEEMLVFFEKNYDAVLLDKLNRSYLYALEDMYSKTKLYLQDRKEEKALRRKLLHQWKKEKRRYPISIQSHPGLYNALFPKYSYAYWTAKGFISKVTGR